MISYIIFNLLVFLFAFEVDFRLHTILFSALYPALQMQSPNRLFSRFPPEPLHKRYIIYDSRIAVMSLPYPINWKAALLSLNFQSNSREQE